MLKYSKISKYKIEKILRCFAQDLTAVETQKILKLNIRTVERYYNIFRSVLRIVTGKILLDLAPTAKYIGYIHAFYCEHPYFAIFKYGENFYLANVLSEKPEHNRLALLDNDFSEFSNFFYNRVKKFYGFTQKTYENQLIETSIRWFLKDSDSFYNEIYKNLKHYRKS